MDKINYSVNSTDRLNLKSNYLKSTRKEKYSLQPSASLTVESAFIFPFFFLAIVILVLFLDLYRIQSVIQASLSQSSRELGMYAYCESDDEASPVGAVSSALCIAYAKTQLSNALKEEALPQILGHKNGISLLMSSYQNGRITLKASFLYKSPVALIPLQPISVTIVSSVHAWTGYDSNNTDMDTSDSVEMVYVTDYQGVYHTFSDCTYLSLSVTTASKSNLSSLRNVYGEKYHPCERCVRSSSNQNTFYITQSGNRYHSSSSCGGLTRHVRLIKKSELQNLHLCSRCAQRNGGH